MTEEETAAEAGKIPPLPEKITRSVILLELDFRDELLDILAKLPSEVAGSHYHVLKTVKPQSITFNG
jgi:hypothetical protein